MPKFLVWVNTYNRPKLFLELYSSIQKEKKDHLVDLFLFDDCSTEVYPNIESLCKFYFKSPVNNGKNGYGDLINIGLSTIRQYKLAYNYYIKIDDDMLLCPDFFDRIVKLWDGLEDKNKATLDILSVKRQRGKNLQGYPVPIVQYGHKYFRTQWVDMNFVFDPEVLTDIKIQLPKGNLRRATSGVGLFVSRVLLSRAKTMYQTTVSLLVHQGHDSKMHPEERKKNKLITEALK